MDGPPRDLANGARRRFLKGTGAITTSLAAKPILAAPAPAQSTGPNTGVAAVKVRFQVNGAAQELLIDPRVTLLDALHEQLHLTGSKKGCDRGQCGACTVHVDGRRVNSCLTLAATLEGAKVVTIEGLGGERMHPAQAAFLERDAFQCGYCTPGQIMSCVALVEESRNGAASAVTENLDSKVAIDLSDDEIRERMSGNICRCGAYVNIVAAVRDVSRRRA
jgi:xanthine dehydrogenase YagT iron-sulfur-binding subunit